MAPNPPQTLRFLDLGRIAYRPALELQREIHTEVLEGRCPPTVLLLEHDPVITVTPRDGVAGHVLANTEALKVAGVELCETDRGGDVTYHGPGQLVAYPILPLQPLGMNVREYVCMLEWVIIDTLARFGVTAKRDPAGIGVWTGDAKIAAIGVRIRRWIAMHGLALNVTTNLDHFKLIVPCGLTRPVTSLQTILGPRCPAIAEVKAAMSEAFRERARLTDKRGPACPTVV